VTEIEPPTDDLRALFGHERDISDVERVAIREKLAVSVGAPPAAATAIASSKLVWVAAAAIAAAATIWWVTQHSEPASSPSAPSSEPAPMIAPAPTITTTAPEPTPPGEEPAVMLAPQALDRPDAPRRAGPSQPELLAKAWQALAKDPAQALKLVELDARLHARGALVEEREALRIQALVALDRRDEAAALAAKFSARFPRSVHRATVERSVR
jgi:hypothetical protein